MRADPRITAHLASEQADIQTRILVLEDALLVMERLMDDLLGHLAASGQMGEEIGFVTQFRERMKTLRERGLPRRALPGDTPVAGVTCPGCQALLRNVVGQAGDRCDWCGYIFPNTCPGCGRTVDPARAGQSTTCLYCQHQLG